MNFVATTLVQLSKTKEEDLIKKVEKKGKKQEQALSLCVKVANFGG